MCARILLDFDLDSQFETPIYLLHFDLKKLVCRNAQTLVMVADPEYHAAKVYESVGFEPTQKAIGMCRYSKEEWT